MKNPLLSLILLIFATFPVSGQNLKLVVPVGHVEFITSVNISPNGKFIVSASRDHTVKIWDRASGKLLHTFVGHLDEVNQARFSPDSKFIASASKDKSVKLWSIDSMRLVTTLKGHDDHVYDVQWSGDGKIIMSGGDDGTIAYWSRETGERIRLLDSDSYDHKIRLSPTGSKILLQSPGKFLLTDLNKREGTKLLSFEGRTAVFSPPSLNDLEGGKKILTTTPQKVRLWNAETAEVLIAIDSDGIVSFNGAGFSPDGKIVVTYGDNLKLWDASSGKLLRALGTDLQLDNVRIAEFSPDGKYLATEHPRTVYVWEVSSGRLVYKLDAGPETVSTINFDATGKTLVTACGWVRGGDENIIRIWDVASGKMEYQLKGYSFDVHSVRFSTDSKTAIQSARRGAKIIDLTKGTVMANLPDQNGSVYDAGYIMQDKYMYTQSLSLKIWDSQSRELYRSLEGTNFIYVSAFHGQYACVADHESTRLLDIPTGNNVILDKHKLRPDGIKFSPDGKTVLSWLYDSLNVWRVPQGTLLHSFKTEIKIQQAQFSPDGKKILASSDGKSKNVFTSWDVQSGKLLRSSETELGWYHSVLLSNDSKYMAIGRYQEGTEVIVRDVVTSEVLGELPYDMRKAEWEYNMFSPDNTMIMTVFRDKRAVLWDPITGNVLRTIQVKGRVMDINAEWTRMIADENSVETLYDLTTGSEMLSWIAIDTADWVVMHPSGLFDASQGAMDKLYFAQGVDIIELSQLKERYYEPGLWKKVLNKEALRNVMGMKGIEFAPDIHVGQVDNKGYLPIELVNRGFGIGKVSILINGKEVIADARPNGANPKAASMTIKYFIANNKVLIRGAENLISVKAWNENHWIVGRGQMISYTPPGTEGAHKPAIHIIACGVSDYTGTELDLKYAAKDAEDVSNALRLGAKQLFGIEQSFVYTLTTSTSSPQHPTKTAIVKTLQQVAAKAHPLDIVVVYLSGHGINHGGQDGDWYYLTQDAYTSSSAAYNDPEIRKRTTISSNELVDLLKAIPALKQVLMIDACASGKVVENLMAKKDIESSTLRALDRMRDRTGMHILTGCTSDAVSYEASKYGQGVLTYSLLEGIRGAALRENKFVDVNKLFQYARDRVPVLAGEMGIGNTQTPEVYSPQGAQSFDIGQLEEESKKQIPIAAIRPVFIRSAFQDEDEFEDVLQLSKKVDDLLNEAAGKGASSPIIFVDVREYPEGCKLNGRYKQENGVINLKLRKKCGGKDQTIDLQGTNLAELTTKILNIL